MSRPFCRYCMDRGCLICDRHNPARLRRRVQEEEAFAFLQARQIRPDAELLELVIEAMEHGATRHERTGALAEETVEPPGQRWERLEF